MIRPRRHLFGQTGPRLALAGERRFALRGTALQRLFSRISFKAILSIHRFSFNCELKAMSIDAGGLAVLSAPSAVCDEALGLLAVSAAGKMPLNASAELLSSMPVAISARDRMPTRRLSRHNV